MSDLLLGMKMRADGASSPGRRSLRHYNDGEWPAEEYHVGIESANTPNQIQKGLSVHAWPTGHATDMEEAIRFARLQDVDCMIEKFPLEKANEAYGKCLEYTSFYSPLTSWTNRCHAQWQCSLQGSHLL